MWGVTLELSLRRSAPFDLKSVNVFDASTLSRRGSGMTERMALEERVAAVSNEQRTAS